MAKWLFGPVSMPQPLCEDYLEQYSKVQKFIAIYPSQRQNLLPTLEILIQNFENFQIFKILEKNSQFQNFFPKFPKPQRGRH